MRVTVDELWDYLWSTKAALKLGVVLSYSMLPPSAVPFLKLSVTASP